MNSAVTLWTIGHSARSAEEFIGALEAHHIQMLADVRRYPGSRRFPHFGANPLATSLAEAGIGYLAFAELGGGRSPRPDSVNTAWREAALRGYADYMETDIFQKAVERLVQTAARQSTAIMCAERAWRHCHRALIADHLKAAGIDVIHIEDAGKSSAHHFTDAARLFDGKLSYRDAQSTLAGFW